MGCPFMNQSYAMRRYLAVILVSLACTSLFAQTGVERFVRKVGTLIDTMSVRGVDRRYIDAPEKAWQFIVKGNANQSVVSMKTEGTIMDAYYEASPYMKTEPSRYIGVWAGYRGYGLGYTVNVAGDKGSYFTLGATGGAYGISIRFHSFDNDAPNFDLSSDLVGEENKEDWSQVQLRDPIKVHTVTADGYYFFNGKRFSYAAAYDQSVIQKRSAGSVVAGAMYYYSHIDYADHTNGDLIYLMHGLGRVKLWQASVGVGYAYNWSIAPSGTNRENGLLISIMAVPMVTFVNRIRTYSYSTNMEQLMTDPTFWNNDIENEDWDNWFYDHIKIAPQEEKTINSNPSLDINSRLSLTYNFGRYFMSAYGQFHNSRFSHNKTSGYLNDWLVNASIGIRL